MEIKSFNKDIAFDENRAKTTVILETPLSKEVRITMKSGQIMKEHKSPFPIVIHILEGEIELGAEGSTLLMKTGDIIALEGNVLHDLKAKKSSIIRLTLTKMDKVSRVENVAKE